MSNALNRPALWVTATVAVALLSACKAYKADLIGDRPSSGGGQGGDSGGGGGTSGAGGMDADGGAGTRGDGGMCMDQPEDCNLVDDDCDGDTDEDTVAACEKVVLNAETECVHVNVDAGLKAYCLKVKCLAGFADRDGFPTNGCETALDEGDGGSDEDAGP